MNMLPSSRDQAAMLSFFHLTVFEAMMRLKSVTLAADELELPGSVAKIVKLEHAWRRLDRSEEHTSELQSLMRISYAVFCLKKKINTKNINTQDNSTITQTTQ